MKQVLLSILRADVCKWAVGLLSFWPCFSCTLDCLLSHHSASPFFTHGIPCSTNEGFVWNWLIWYHLLNKVLWNRAYWAFWEPKCVWGGGLLSSLPCFTVYLGLLTLPPLCVLCLTPDIYTNLVHIKVSFALSAAFLFCTHEFVATWIVYIGVELKAITPATATGDSNYCTCLGHLGRRDTDGIVSI